MNKIPLSTFVVFFSGMLAFMFFSTNIAAAANISSLFDPPLTQEEKKLYQAIGNNQKEIERFVKTRLFIRKAMLFSGELPKGVDYSPAKHGCPQPPGEKSDFVYTAEYNQQQLNLEYLTSFDEQLLFLNMINCIGLSGRSHPEGVYCGAPVDKNSVLSQLTPPISPKEMQLLDKAIMCPASEIPQFLATRIYMRRIKALMAELPAGQKFDSQKAPPLPEKFNAHYTTDDEGVWFDIYNDQLIKALSDQKK
jgi:hypothetical protein